MLRGLYLTLVYLTFLALGGAAPFILSLGYVWVDLFDPQAVATELLDRIPVSLIMGAAAVGGFFLLDRGKGRPGAFTVILLLFAAWVTFTTASIAVAPAAAWEKWNYAVKTLAFASLIPLVFRSRTQIEALLQIMLFSIALHFVPVGIKTLYSGGGYGRELGVLSGNALLAEGSTLAGVALMLVPLILYLRRHTTLLPRGRLSTLIYTGLCVCAVSAAIGTYERTALLGVAIVGLGVWVRSRHKLLYGLIGIAGVIAAASMTSSAWNARISTVKNLGAESSALGRFLVWRWTWNFVHTHPLGGGFNAYVVDEISIPTDDPGAPLVIHGKAFHSIYFEVLGEQGFPGVALFASLVATAFLSLRRVRRATRGITSLAWARDLAYALQVSLVTILVCGAFIGIAFQPMIYEVLALAACLGTHVRMAVAPPRPSLTPDDEDWAALAASPGFTAGQLAARR